MSLQVGASTINMFSVSKMCNIDPRGGRERQGSRLIVALNFGCSSNIVAKSTKEEALVEVVIGKNAKGKKLLLSRRGRVLSIY